MTILKGLPLEGTKTVAKLDRMLQIAQEQGGRPMSTETSKREGEAFMSKKREDEAVALSKLIERKELISSSQIQARWGVTRQSVSEAVKAGRLFALIGPSGENFYPAFFVDGRYDRRSLEKVSKALGSLPASVKYHFFTSRSHRLGGKTPLEAIAEGRLAETLVAATGFAER